MSSMRLGFASVHLRTQAPLSRLCITRWGLAWSSKSAVILVRICRTNQRTEKGCVGGVGCQ
eukprot:8786837-Pyramimonas_sp.AAC.1